MIHVERVDDDGLPPIKVVYCMDSKTYDKLMCSYWRLTEQEAKEMVKGVREAVKPKEPVETEKQ